MKKSILFLFVFLTQFSYSQTDVSGIIKSEVVVKHELGYLLHLPKNTKDKKPLIVFLHGSGERGTNTELLKIHGPFKYLKTNDLDAYVLAPQCRENEMWDNESLYNLIMKIKKENNIDSSRIYLTGLSIGGYGTWNLAFAHPEVFAALVPIAGFTDRMQSQNVCIISGIPTQIYHGLLDNVVSVDYSIDMYKKLKACNATVNLTIFDDCGHDSWTKVYDNNAIYDWMFAQSKK